MSSDSLIGDVESMSDDIRVDEDIVFLVYTTSLIVTRLDILL